MENCCEKPMFLGFWSTSNHIGVYTSQGRGTKGLQPPPLCRAKHYFFGQSLNFSGRRSSQKYFLSIFLKRKHRNHLVQRENWLKSGSFTNYWVGSSFFGRCRNIFRQRCIGCPSPYKKLAGTPMPQMSNFSAFVQFYTDQPWFVDFSYNL